MVEMKRALLVVGIAALIVLSIAGVAFASESYVISDYSGAAQQGGTTIVDNSTTWRYAPENPRVVYITVWAPEPYKNYITKAIVEVVRSQGLKAVVVNDVSKYDLKGRLVVAFFPYTEWNNGVLSREVTLSGILYYSYDGDAKSIINATRAFDLSKDAISTFAGELCQASSKRMVYEHIVNRDCNVAYWWNLKAKVGKLNQANPYEMAANEISSQLKNFLLSDNEAK
ncbi:hypothetical protein [Thermococcus sp. GR6]|uniref:hypothetical protein n=1 Tax=Thermococcus sp. GR6 TaxID=1638256 RepID=UPI001431A9E6|nr:hypothetical protein [Thermococcus sp. GR6]NJE42291.1 hypothetical protein [Thermococcus sp. GR6]